MPAPGVQVFCNPPPFTSNASILFVWETTFFLQPAPFCVERFHFICVGDYLLFATRLLLRRTLPFYFCGRLPSFLQPAPFCVERFHLFLWETRFHFICVETTFFLQPAPVYVERFHFIFVRDYLLFAILALLRRTLPFYLCGSLPSFATRPLLRRTLPFYFCGRLPSFCAQILLPPCIRHMRFFPAPDLLRGFLRRKLGALWDF